MGCVSTATPEHFAQELVHPVPPSRGFRSLGQEIFVDQGTIELMRSLVEARGENLVAILQLPQGVHPYMVLAFTETGGGTEVLATSVYWGRVQGKWLAKLDNEELRSIIEQAVATFECRSGRVSDPVTGAALIYWPSGSQVSCDGGFVSKEGAVVAERIQPILDEARPIYDGGEQ
jgi:hypothetical protein